MSDFFGELMESIDSLTEEQVNALLSKLEVKRAGSQKIQEESKDEQAPMACPHCGTGSQVMSIFYHHNHALTIYQQQNKNII